MLVLQRILILVLVLSLVRVVYSWVSSFVWDRPDTATVRRIVDSEELILELTPVLKGLNKSVLNLKLPDHHSRGLFADVVDTVDLDEQQAAVSEQYALDKVRAFVWPISAEQHHRPLLELDMWQPLITKIDYFQHAKFYIIRGEFTDAGQEEFRCDLGFKGQARGTDGYWHAVHAEQELIWRRDGTPATQNEPGWQITSWRMKELDTIEREELMFHEALSRALPRNYDLRRARKSKHEQILVDSLITGKSQLRNPLYNKYFLVEADISHPGLSVVDIDADGWDDLYVTQRWDKNLLFRNRGDGTFVEMAAKVGLDIAGVSTGGIFADFDNDGDRDLFLGRALQPSLYLENLGGRFVDRTAERIAAPKIFLVTSVSAADYNGDGLLDVYLSTYGYRGEPFEGWENEFLTGDDARQFRRRMKSPANHLYLSLAGPPNYLLVNRGGRFEIAEENEQVALWHNSFQGTWSDYDDDGDPDLYVSSDYAPDYLLRNDGDQGFIDVTRTEGNAAMLGFGMGATWGDYDNDGRQDLYVSNMYSKAGARITRQIPGLAPEFSHSAAGNLLFRNRGGQFDHVSASDPAKQVVAGAGWSWGGQFVDVNNDGFLDIYVSSGNFSAPAEVARDVDS